MIFLCRGIEGIDDVLRMGRLRWFRHMEMIRVDNWVKSCMSVTMEGRVPRGRPRKSSRDVLHNDLRVTEFNR